MVTTLYIYLLLSPTSTHTFHLTGRKTKPNMKSATIFALSLAFILLETSAEQCGKQARGAPCPNGFPSGGGGDDVGNIISASLFEQLLKHRNDGACEGKGFYTYNAFITAARSFGGFGTTGDSATRKRELAAFLAQTSHETTGGAAGSPDGPYAWGYCFITERDKTNKYCKAGAPCAPGKSYYGRGPIQLTHNYNYDQAGKAIREDLINNPDLVAKNAVVSFKTALWFWMTPQGNKPSCHNVITNRWTPSAADKAAGRVPGYGVITNIINGKFECGKGPTQGSGDRIGFYKRYCNILGLSYGANLNKNKNVSSCVICNKITYVSSRVRILQ